MADDKTVPPHQAATRPERPVSGVEDTVVPASNPSSAAELLQPAHPDDFGELRVVDENTYTMGPELARGGMGRILYARDRRHGRAVAIKQLTLDGDAARRRFEREALITARLSHPAIVPV